MHEVKAGDRKPPKALRMVKDIARQYPRRVALIVVAASAFGFAISPATVLAFRNICRTPIATRPAR